MDADTAPQSRLSAGRVRSILAGILIVVAVILAPVSAVAIWATTVVGDTDRFVATLSPLIDDPAIQELLVDQTMRAVESQVDIPALTDQVFTSIEELGLSARAAAALRLLEGPAVQGITAVVRDTATTVVSSDQFATVWSDTLRISHRQIIGALTDGDQTLSISDTGEVGLQLGPTIAAIKANLLDRDMTIASIIPDDVDRTIVLSQSDALVSVRTGYQLLEASAIALPAAAVVLLIAGIALGRQRIRVVAWAAAGTVVAMLALGGALLVVRAATIDSLSPEYVSSAAAVALFDAIVPQLAVSIIAIGVIAAVVSLVAGLFRRLFALRRPALRS